LLKVTTISLMTQAPLLFIGGAGAIGRQTAHLLRATHPEVPLLIGGRDLAKTEAMAAEIGHAQGVQLDLTAPDLGLGQRPLSAVVIFYMDHTFAALRFAQGRRIPFLSISTGIFEIAPEIAAYMHQPHAAAIVLGYEWLVGATTVPALEAANAFSRVQQITIGALIDEQDAGGPAVAADFEHLAKMMPAAFTRRDNAYLWRAGEDAKTTFRAVDGTLIDATGFSSIDVVGLATATNAPNVAFNLAIGVSSTRRRGEPKSTEIILELTGEDHAGQPLRIRQAVVHRGGAAPLTGLGVALLLERLTGLDSQAPTPAGLYFPHQLLVPTTYLARLEQSGGTVLPLEVL
jgi:hypothetical protein